MGKWIAEVLWGAALLAIACLLLSDRFSPAEVAGLYFIVIAAKKL